MADASLNCAHVPLVFDRIQHVLLTSAVNRKRNRKPYQETRAYYTHQDTR